MIAQIPARVDPHGAVGLAVFMGLVIFATTTAIIHIGQRRRWSERETQILAENAGLRARCDRADILLASEPQIIVAWGGPGGEPGDRGRPGPAVGQSTRTAAFSHSEAGCPRRRPSPSMPPSTG